MVSSSQVPNERLVNWNPLRESPAHGEAMSPISSDGSTLSNSRPHTSKSLRTACDLCRQSRIKCSGGSTCQRCASNGLKCNYGVSLRNGRLKATAGSISSSSSGTKRPRRDSSKPDGERATQNTSFNILTHSYPMNKLNTDKFFSDLTMATDQEFLMGNGDFTNISPLPMDSAFNYPSPNSIVFPVCTSHYIPS
jgi:hypothetical protein